MSRRELLKRGGVGAAAVAGMGGLGGLVGSAAAATSKSSKFTGTLRVISLGVEFPTPEVAKRIKKDLGFVGCGDRDRPGDRGAEGDHRPGDVRRLRRLQLPGHPGLVDRDT